MAECVAVNKQSDLELPKKTCKTLQRCKVLLDSFPSVSDTLLPCLGPLVRQQEAGCAHHSSCGLWHRHNHFRVSSGSHRAVRRGSKHVRGTA